MDGAKHPAQIVDVDRAVGTHDSVHLDREHVPFQRFQGASRTHRVWVGYYHFLCRRKSTVVDNLNVNGRRSGAALAGGISEGTKRKGKRETLLTV